MSEEPERTYTINLGKALLSQSQHRSVRAINMIREFARHHTKVEEVKIEEELAHKIWARGVRSPPRKVRVRIQKTDGGYALVSLYDFDAEPKDTTPAATEEQAAATTDAPADTATPAATEEQAAATTDAPDTLGKEESAPTSQPSDSEQQQEQPATPEQQQEQQQSQPSDSEQQQQSQPSDSEQQQQSQPSDSEQQQQSQPSDSEQQNQPKNEESKDDK